MSYYVNGGGEIKIPKAKEMEALAAVELGFVNAIAWASLPATYVHLDEMLKAMGFELLDDEGSIVVDNYPDAKSGDEAEIFELLSPFIDAGGHFEWHGEDGEHWRWEFDGEAMNTLTGKVVFAEHDTVEVSYGSEANDMAYGHCDTCGYILTSDEDDHRQVTGHFIALDDESADATERCRGLEVHLPAKATVKIVAVEVDEVNGDLWNVMTTIRAEDCHVGDDEDVTSDAYALDRIAQALSRVDLSAVMYDEDALDEINDLVKSTGRTIAFTNAGE